MRLFSNTYLVGTELVFPYVRGERTLINTEDLEKYVKRNEQKERGKILKMMKLKAQSYSDVFRELLENNLSDNNDIEEIMAANKVLIQRQSALY